MNATASTAPGHWTKGQLPENVRIGSGTVITDELAFKRFKSRMMHGLSIGEQCTMDGVHFSIGEQGQVEIGNYCYFTSVVLDPLKRERVNHMVIALLLLLATVFAILASIISTLRMI